MATEAATVKLHRASPLATTQVLVYKDDMDTYPTPKVEPRLQKRYRQLVSEHLNNQENWAAGSTGLSMDTKRAFAATQAAWRFYQNETVSLPKLIEPLIEVTRTTLAESASDFALVVHDLSPLDYRHHQRKTDRKPLANKNDLGYLL